MINLGSPDSTSVKDVKKYLDTMKKQFPKIEKKLLKY